MTAVSVIVPARDSADTLPRTLAALRSQSVDGGFEVIVVDDGSRDSTRRIAEDAGEPIRCVAGPRSGPAAARNLGVASSRAPRLAFTDADCQPAPGWLEQGVRALEEAEVVQGRVLPDPGRKVGPFDRTLWVIQETGLYETANLFTTRAAFDRAGGFEECLAPAVGKALGEDAWFGWRARRAGARTAFRPDALVYHAVFPRSAEEYVAERRRLQYFPELAQRMPELRRTLCFGRVFLTRRTAAFDAALTGLAAALAARRAAPLLAMLPYLREVRRRTGRYGTRVAIADMAADLVGLAALVRGSLRSGSFLL